MIDLCGWEIIQLSTDKQILMSCENECKNQIDRSQIDCTSSFFILYQVQDMFWSNSMTKLQPEAAPKLRQFTLLEGTGPPATGEPVVLGLSLFRQELSFWRLSRTVFLELPPVPFPWLSLAIMWRIVPAWMLGVQLKPVPFPCSCVSELLGTTNASPPGMTPKKVGSLKHCQDKDCTMWNIEWRTRPHQMDSTIIE